MSQSMLANPPGSEPLLDRTRLLVDTARQTCASIDALSAKIANCRERLEASATITAGACPFAQTDRP